MGEQIPPPPHPPIRNLEWKTLLGFDNFMKTLVYKFISYHFTIQLVKLMCAMINRYTYMRLKNILIFSSLLPTTTFVHILFLICSFILNFRSQLLFMNLFVQNFHSHFVFTSFSVHYFWLQDKLKTFLLFLPSSA